MPWSHISRVFWRVQISPCPLSCSSQSGGIHRHLPSRVWRKAASSATRWFSQPISMNIEAALSICVRGMNCTTRLYTIQPYCFCKMKPASRNGHLPRSEFRSCVQHINTREGFPIHLLGVLTKSPQRRRAPARTAQIIRTIPISVGNTCPGH